MHEREPIEQRIAALQMAKTRLIKNHLDDLTNWMTISDEKVAEIKALIKKTINLPADTELSLATFGDKRSAFLNYGGPNQDSNFPFTLTATLES